MTKETLFYHQVRVELQKIARVRTYESYPMLFNTRSLHARMQNNLLFIFSTKTPVIFGS